MINLNKLEQLHELDQEEYALWCHDIALIKRLVNAISKPRKPPTEIFKEFKRYYFPDYLCKENPKLHVDPCQEFRDQYDFADHLIYAISRVIYIERFYPFNRYPLYLDRFIERVTEFGLHRMMVLDRKELRYEVIRRLNDCIYEIYRDIKSLRAKTELKRVRDKQRRQVKSANEYIDDLFIRHSRLLVIRLDFGYGEYADSSLEQLCDHRDQLLQYLRKKHASKALVGYIWKMEYGFKKGYHIHCMLFFDGAKVQQSITHGQLIGDYWNDVITQGDGNYYNCNAKMDDYKYCGLGMVSHHETRKIDNVKRASMYLTKHDEWIELLHYGYQYGDAHDGDDLDFDDSIMQHTPITKLRVFRTGELGELLPRRGRPRYTDGLVHGLTHDSTHHSVHGLDDDDQDE